MVDTPKITPVILSGESGTRLWPMSRESYPKQLLPLVSERSLLQETAACAENSGRFAAPIVVCNSEHRFVVAQQLRCIGQTPRAILLAPIGRNTALAAAVAAITLAQDDEDALVLLLPSDHSIADTLAFRSAVAKAAEAAVDGAPVKGHSGCFTVAEFIEKPDHETAKGFLAGGGYDWNSGMFLFKASTYLEELERLEPEILTHCRASLDKGETDLDFIRLAEKPFSQCKSKSIDYAVMEHTDKAAVVPADIGWNDVGSWTALWEDGAKDGSDNVIVGDVMALDSARSYLRSEGPLIAALGVDDLVVVATTDAILVAPKDRAQDVRTP